MPIAAALDCLLIADDLTGACDAGAPFAVRGRRAIVPLSPDSAAGAQVLALTTESRDLEPALVPEAIAGAARLADGRARVVFKKIDSTLRGHPAVEIAAAMQVFHCRAAVVCPAFPAMNRIVHGGYLKVEGAAYFEPVHLPTRLSCAHIAAGDIRIAIERGEHIVSLDAHCDADLDRIAAAILELDGPVLWVGSAGLAGALARTMGEPAKCPPRHPQTGTVLFCLGSEHPVTQAQESALLATGSTCRAGDDSTAGRLAEGRHVLLRIPPDHVEPEAIRERLAGAAPAALALSGGATASLICRSLGVQSIELCDELVPGIPRGVLRGGAFDGMPVVTKSGGFGNVDALIRIADYFACPNL